jgi:predicted chitinase
VIFNTDLDDDGKLSARVNGRVIQLTGKRNYLPLSPYSRYEVELQNSKNSSTATTLSATARAV